jgi:DNA-binding transcriptional regulator YdaS (Cro superfamily)
MDKNLIPKNQAALDAIARVINICGGSSGVVKRFCVTRQTVHNWVTGKTQIPLNTCVMIEQELERQVTCEDLRPDLMGMWRYLREQVAVREL